MHDQQPQPAVHAMLVPFPQILDFLRQMVDISSFEAPLAQKFSTALGPFEKVLVVKRRHFFPLCHCFHLITAYEPFQLQGVLRGKPLLVVIEIRIDGAQFASPTFDLLGPSFERLFRIAALISAGRAMQAQVREVSGDFDARKEPGDFEYAECRVMPPENTIDLFGMPGGISKLESVWVAAR